MIGRKLDRFEVVEHLGSGGMGEVYRATDTSLGRDVALKVLAAELASEESLRRRLEREARAISSLNHPHICTLYEIGRQEGTTFLVMELLEGETLAARLTRGPLPVAEALRIGAQVAGALAAAHRRGLVHRDLKPGNVMLTRSGAKLLDFGLAKPAAPAEPPAGSLSASPTLSGPLTADGALVGTLPYMAPEQVEGRAADARTDVFALGSVLYEMLTGARAFQVESRAGLIAAILKETPPPLAELAPAVPPALDRLVGKCLAKAPDDRWQSAADLADELEWIGAASGDAGALAPAPRAAALPRVLVFALAGALGLGAGWWLASARSAAAPSEGSPTRLSIPLPPEAPFYPSERSALAISGDGRAVVYAGGSAADHRLYRRTLDDDRVLAVEGSDGGVGPFFAPDGQRLGFFVGMEMRAVALTGGPSQRIATAPPVTRGAEWLANGDIVMSPNKAGPLMLIPRPDPSLARPLSWRDPDAIGTGHSWPELFAGGSRGLVTIIGPEDRSYDEADIVALDFASGEQSVVVEGGSQAHLLPTGHLAFIRHGELFAAPFDPDRMALTAPPRAVLGGVLSDPSSGVAHLAISPSGTLVYARGASASSTDRRLVWLDAERREQPIEVAPQAYFTPTLSPDGRQLALAISSASDDIWILDLARRVFRRLTFGGRNLLPIWSPDGERITFASVRGGGYPSVYSIAADGSGEAEPLLELAADQTKTAYFPASWSPEGDRLVITHFAGASSGTDIEIARPGETPRPLLATRFNEGGAQISPDGAWLAYMSDASGQWEVYVTPFPEPGVRLQVSLAGGTQPAWAPSGELLFRAGRRLMAARILGGARPSVGALATRYEGDELVDDTTLVGLPFFDAAADGRLLLVLGKPPPRVDRLEVVLGWLTELERMVPAP